VVQQPLQLQNRAHFFAVAAQLMRQILVDYACNLKAAKRRYDCQVTLDEAVELRKSAILTCSRWTLRSRNSRAWIRNRHGLSSCVSSAGESA
jgi:hypothetical protein